MIALTTMHMYKHWSISKHGFLEACTFVCKVEGECAMHMHSWVLASVRDSMIGHLHAAYKDYKTYNHCVKQHDIVLVYVGTHTIIIFFYNDIHWLFPCF